MNNKNIIRDLPIRRNLNEDTRKQGVLVSGEVYSMHFTDTEVIITDNKDYTKIYAVYAKDFWMKLNQEGYNNE